MAQGPRKYLKPALHRVLLPLARWYLSKPRRDRYEGIQVDVPPGVFHPRFFFSTRLMLKHLHRHVFQDRTVLEIGAGSGLVSVWCAREGARVTATDISLKAVEAVRHNAEINGVSITVVRSDLFHDLPEQRFDFVIMNPPYYPRQPRNEEEQAWFCGAGFEYFERLFLDLHRYRNPGSTVLMVLSEDCDIDRIRTIAERNHWDMEMIHPERKFGEWSFIFSLRYKRVA